MSASAAGGVDPSNAEQAASWDGEQGARWAADAERFDRLTDGFLEVLLRAADVAAGERVLDIGCGSGTTTLLAARRAAPGPVLGLDLSAALLVVARRRTQAAGLDNVAFEHGDVQVHPLGAGSFDVALSRLGVMFFGDAVAAFANVARALRPGGRLAVAVWQPPGRNEWFSSFVAAFAAGRDLPQPPPGAPGPFALADPDRIRDVLVRGGFQGVAIQGVERPAWFGADPDDAQAFVGRQFDWLLEGLDAAGRARSRLALRRSLEQHHGAGGVTYGTAAWVVTARGAGC